MPTVQATLSNQRAGSSSLGAGTLAVISLVLTVEQSLFGKIGLTASLRANWNAKFNNAQYPLDSIKLEVGYPDSNGIMTYRNSGKLISAGHLDSMAPLIWNQSNQQQTFQTSFLRGASNDITVHYKILFKISPALPPGFKDAFLVTEKLQIGKQTQDFTLKVFLQ